MDHPTRRNAAGTAGTHAIRRARRSGAGKCRELAARHYRSALCVRAPGQTEATLLLSATKEVASWTGAIQIVGSASVEGASIRQLAHSATLMSATANVEAARPSGRAMRHVVLSVAASDPAVARIDLGNPDDARAVWRTSLGGKLSIPVKYSKVGTVKGELVLVPVGVPAEVKAANVTLAADAAGRSTGSDFGQ